MIRLRRGAAWMGIGLAALFAGIAACGDDGDATGTSGTSIFGTYTLQTVDGTNLPFVLFQIGNDKLEITAGSVRLNSDNTYSLSISLRVTQAGTVTTETDTGAGTFTATGSTIQFSDPGDGSGSFTGSISGNTLTIIDDVGFTFVFGK